MVSDEASPLGLAKEVEELLKLPPHLCKQRGVCCRVATFKGFDSQTEIEALAHRDPASCEDPETAAIESEMAKDFLDIFIRYDSVEPVRKQTPEFVERVYARAREKDRSPESVDFFHCKYVLEDGRCGVHEDRPTGCRTYPFPHEKTLYHKGCGFEAQGKANWKRIQEILEMLELSIES